MTYFVFIVVLYCLKKLSFSIYFEIIIKKICSETNNSKTHLKFLVIHTAVWGQVRFLFGKMLCEGPCIQTIKESITFENKICHLLDFRAIVVPHDHPNSMAKDLKNNTCFINKTFCSSSLSSRMQITLFSKIQWECNIAQIKCKLWDKANNRALYMNENCKNINLGG